MVGVDDQRTNSQLMSLPRVCPAAVVVLVTIRSAIAAAKAAWNHEWPLASLGNL